VLAPERLVTPNDTCSVNRSFYRLLVLLALFWPATGWAHALSHAYYPLGLVPEALAAEWWPFAFVPLAAIAVEAFSLWLWAPMLGAWGVIWRAAVLYVAAQLAQMVAELVLSAFPLFQYAGWRSSIDDVIALAVFVTAGVVIAIPVGPLLFRRVGLRPRRVIAAACVASLVGYLSAFGLCMVLVKIRGF